MLHMHLRAQAVIARACTSRVHRPEMAPRLTLAEQDILFTARESGKTIRQAFAALQKRRAREGTPMVIIPVVRRLLRGRAHRRGRQETRGRRRALSRLKVLTMDAARRVRVWAGGQEGGREKG